MLKFFYLLVTIAMIHSLEEESLTKYSDNEINYFARYTWHGTSHWISFNINNPSEGIIGEIKDVVNDRINDDRVMATIKNNKIFTCSYVATNLHHPIMLLNPSDHYDLLKIYQAVTKEFETKKKNNTLPPIQQFK